MEANGRCRWLAAPGCCRRPAPPRRLPRPLLDCASSSSSILHPAAFRYSSRLAPRRLLTKPAEPASNGGWDNASHDLIVAVGDEFVSTLGVRYVVKDLLGQGTFGQARGCACLRALACFPCLPARGCCCWPLLLTALAVGLCWLLLTDARCSARPQVFKCVAADEEEDSGAEAIAIKARSAAHAVHAEPGRAPASCCAAAGGVSVLRGLAGPRVAHGGLHCMRSMFS